MQVTLRSSSTAEILFHSSDSVLCSQFSFRFSLLMFSNSFSFFRSSDLNENVDRILRENLENLMWVFKAYFAIFLLLISHQLSRLAQLVRAWC